ncbi:MAG: transposase [Candidatus Omnitrophota bacterium]
MPIREIPLFMDGLYHVYNKSIADFKIFNNENDYRLILDLIRFYLHDKSPCTFREFRKICADAKAKDEFLASNPSPQCTNLVCYCIMPTHIHLVLKEVRQDGISNYMRHILNSYSRYFNIKYERKGPLWENRFGNVLIKNDEQLLHLTRYLHLNPVTAYLVENPEDWKYSSFKEYIGSIDSHEKICNFGEYLTLDSTSYEKFVKENIEYQRQTAISKKFAG